MEEVKGNPPSPASTGLLLIKIGFALVFIIPFAMVFVFGSIVGQFGFFSPFPGGFIFAAVIAFVAIGGALSLVALKFGYDAAKGRQKNKADYVIIMGIVVFLVGSNIAGILIAIGGYLCRKSFDSS